MYLLSRPFFPKRHTERSGPPCSVVHMLCHWAIPIGSMSVPLYSEKIHVSPLIMMCFMCATLTSSNGTFSIPPLCHKASSAGMGSPVHALIQLCCSLVAMPGGMPEPQSVSFSRCFFIRSDGQGWSYACGLLICSEVLYH